MYPELRMSDKKAINRFLRLSGYSPNTIRGYRWTLGRLARYMAHRRVDLNCLTPELFLDFLDDQVTWGENMRVNAFKGARAFVKATYGVEHDFMELRMRRPPPRPQRTLSVDQVMQLLNSFDLDTVKGMRDYALVGLMLDTGLRSAEVCSLELDDLKVADQLLNVRIKGGRWEAATFSHVTADYLEDWLAMREDIALPKSSTVFVSNGGTTPGRPLSRSGLRQIFKRWGWKLGFKISPHDLRRTFATLTTENGGPTEIIRQGGRWRSESQFTRYTQHLNLESIHPYLPMANLEMVESQEPDLGIKTKKDDPPTSVYFVG